MLSSFPSNLCFFILLVTCSQFFFFVHLTFMVCRRPTSIVFDTSVEFFRTLFLTLAALCICINAICGHHVIQPAHIKIKFSLLISLACYLLKHIMRGS